MTRRINAEGLAKITQWEGLVLHAYDDFDPPKARRKIQPGDVVRGTLTIGYGSTGPHVRPGMEITRAEAEALLRQDLDRFERAVDSLVTVPLNDNQFAALCSFSFNVGVEAFKRSTLLKKLNAGQYDAVPTELMKWVSSKGKRLPGLVNRRAAEIGTWNKGAFVASQYVPAKPEPRPFSANDAAGYAGALGTLVAAAGTSGPMQYAMAAVSVLAFLLLAWWIIWGRRA
jgi:lysozyme